LRASHSTTSAAIMINAIARATRRRVDRTRALSSFTLAPYATSHDHKQVQGFHAIAAASHRL
jgi:hypothetical protein